MEIRLSTKRRLESNCKDSQIRIFGIGAVQKPTQFGHKVFGQSVRSIGISIAQGEPYRLLYPWRCE